MQISGFPLEQGDLLIAIVEKELTSDKYVSLFIISNFKNYELNLNNSAMTGIFFKCLLNNSNQ